MTHIDAPFTPQKKAARAALRADPSLAPAGPSRQAMRVGDIMSWPAVSISPVVTPHRAETLAQERGINHLVVCDGEHLIGVLCVCDLNGATANDRVWDCMSAPAITLGPTALIDDAVETMRSRGVGFVPIVRRGQVFGVVTRGDLSRLGALNLEADGQRCASCLSHHHVRPLYGIEDTPFCLSCLERTYPTEFREFYEECGGSD
jgi:acetoin utilization protein AcuB